jgi:hypothetical protein
MLYRIQMWAHAWSWKRSHGFTLKIGGYCPWTMQPSVVMHKHRSCS